MFEVIHALTEQQGNVKGRGWASLKITKLFQKRIGPNPQDYIILYVFVKCNV